MDYSKLSNEELLALKNKDYSKLSNETLLYLKGQGAPKPLTAQQQSVAGNWEGIKDVPLMVPEQAPSQGLSAIGDLVAGKGLQQAAQTAETNEPTSIPGKIGHFIGQTVKPSDLAVMGAFEAGGATAAAKQTAQQFAESTTNKVGRVIEAVKGPTVEEAKIQAQILKSGFRPTATDKARRVGIAGIQEAEAKIAQLKTEAADIVKQAKQTGPATQKAMELAKQRLEPFYQKINTLKNDLLQLPSQAKEKIAELEIMQREAGKAMGEVEAKGGFALKTSPKFESQIHNPQYLSRVAEKLRSTFQQGPETVAEKLKPQNIQKVRKLFQEESGLSGLGHAESQQMRETAAKALQIKSPEFNAARTKYLEISHALEQAPVDAKLKAETLRKSLNDTRELLRQESMKADEMITQVKQTENSAIQDTVTSHIRESKKRLIAAQNELIQSRHQADDLLRRAKNADAEELLRIKDEANKLIQRGLENSIIMRKLKIIGGTALTAVVGSKLSSLLDRTWRH